MDLDFIRYISEYYVIVNRETKELEFILRMNSSTEFCKFVIERNELALKYVKP